MTTALLLLLLFVMLGLAYANGANDNFKATATVYGAGALGYRGALRLATLAQVSGSVASLFLASALIRAFGGKGLVPDAVVGDPLFLIAVGTGAACAVLIATRLGLPISTTHALIGGLVGGGIAFAPGDLRWNMLGAKYAMPLLISPFLAFALTAALYPIAHYVRRLLGIEAGSCACVSAAQQAALAGADESFHLQPPTPCLVLAHERDCLALRYRGAVMGVSAQNVADAIHMCSAYALGFARGLNDTPKVLGILVAAHWSGMNNHVALMLVACVMAVGGILHSRRLAETMGKRITTMNTGQGLLANLVASCLVIGASLMGSPVSTTHVSTGAIVGIGSWTKGSDWRLVGGIGLAWIATLPIGAALAFSTAAILRSLIPGTPY